MLHAFFDDDVTDHVNVASTSGSRPRVVDEVIGMTNEEIQVALKHDPRLVGIATR